MKKSLFLLLALPGLVHAEAQTATAVSTASFYAATNTTTGDVDVDVTSGTTGTNWAAAFGGKGGATLTGDVNLRFSGEFTGASTVFGVVNTGSVTGDVTLVFDAENASYASFTDVGNEKNESVSLVGAYQANINGSFNVVINKGVFQYDILGGVHTGSNTIGSTHITINGGTIADDVYAGGRTGTITGNTAITITNLAALSSHTATNIISAGGKGGTIGGDSSVTFSGVNGDTAVYNGTVSGGTNVTGSSTLLIDNSSTLTLNNVADFDVISISEGASLTVNGNIQTNAQLTVSFDNETIATKTDNGLGRGSFTGLVSGDGQFILGENATINGKVVSGTDGNAFLMENCVYYVMSTPEVTNPYNEYYSYGNGVQVPVGEIVTVGNHNYSGPDATEGTNTALAFYVGENGTLCIDGDSDTMTAAQIFTTTQGTGDIILRAPGYQSEYGLNGYTYELTIQDRTLFAGDLYVSPYCAEQINDSDKTHIISQTGAVLYLEEGANISSFDSVNLCHTESIIAINGEIGQGDGNIGHIHNLTNSGSGFTYLFINQGANDEIVLSGDTVIKSYTHADEEKLGSITTGGEQTTWMRTVFNQDSHVIVQNLTTGDDTIANLYWNGFEIVSAYGDKFAHDKEVNGVVDIESFEYLGYIVLNAQTAGSLHANVNLLSEQFMYDFQYGCSDKALGEQTLTLKGEGTYILSEGANIFGNFGVLSTDFNEDSTRVWRGTVEVNKLDETQASGIDFAYYGNEESTVHFKGFKGFVSGEANAHTTIAEDLKLTNVDGWNAYEIVSGYEGHVQSYTGDIKGDGDFVINAAEGMTFEFTGSLSDWNGGGELILSQGKHDVIFTGNATQINPTVKTTAGTMNATISNDKAVTVGGTFSHAEGGNLNLTVDTAAGTTFTKSIDVSSLATTEPGKAVFNESSTAGNVTISSTSRGGNTAPATVSNGMVISDNRIAGGHAETATLSFTTNNNNEVSSASLQKVTLTSITGSRVTMADIEASEVYLMGKGVDFYSIVTNSQFTVTEAAVEGGKVFNEVRFESDIFDGMTLANDGATATLSVSNELDWGGFAANNELSNVTIMLTGFTLEGYTSGEGWPTENLIFDTGLSNGVADSGVSALLNLDMQKYDVVTYNQKAAGLEIRMEHLPSPTIPEPTTATLSLLALAALAARRRRR